MRSNEQPTNRLIWAKKEEQKKERSNTLHICCTNPNVVVNDVAIQLHSIVRIRVLLFHYYYYTLRLLFDFSYEVEDAKCSIRYQFVVFVTRLQFSLLSINSLCD